MSLFCQTLFGENKLRIKYLLSVFMIMVLTGYAFGNPANPHFTFPITIDGKQILVRHWGDEFIHGYETVDGYSIVHEKQQDVWYYAKLDSEGKLSPTTLIVGKDNPTLFKLNKHIRPGKEYIRKMIKNRDIIGSLKGKNNSRIMEKAQGNWTVPVICIDYPDQPHTFGTNDFKDLLFTVNPESPRSMTDYYKEVSYGKFNVTGDVFGWYTAKHNKAYYGANDENGEDKNAEELLLEAVKAADPSVDFSKYDHDKDGYVDGVMIVFSGHDEASGSEDDIWSFMWYLSTPYETDDGVLIGNYNMQQELYDYDESITTIGVFCHEFGHILGLPDLYDRDYSSDGVGYFELMDIGSYNGCMGKWGDCPAHPSAWCKKFLNFLEPVAITNSNTYQLPTVEENPNCYIIYAGLPMGQYFLVENKRNISFDEGLPGFDGGILIWHIDEFKNDNDDETHRMVDLEQAQADQTLDYTGGDGGDNNDYFRQGKEFTDSSNPNSKSYVGDPSGVSVKDFMMISPEHTYSFRADVSMSNSYKWWKSYSEGITGIFSQPCLGKDGTIYYGLLGEMSEGYLYAVNTDGSLKWFSRTSDNGGYYRPAVRDDGTIFISTATNLLAFDPDGTKLMEFETDGEMDSTPDFGDDGTIYSGSNSGNLYALNPDGTLKWKFTTKNNECAPPVIGKNGVIFTSSNNELYAVNPDGSLKWKFEAGDWIETPAIGKDGTIYIGSEDNSLYAINPDGSLEWSFAMQNYAYFTPYIGSDGTIYAGSADRYLYALKTNGTLKWKFDAMSEIWSTPVQGVDGTIYFGTFDSFYALNPDGTLKKSIQTLDFVSSPVIDTAGTVYFTTGYGGLFAFTNITDTIEFALKINPEKTSYSNGDNFTLELGFQTPSKSTNADIYFVMLQQSTNTLYFGMNFDNNPVPVLKNINIPPDTVLNGVTLLNVNLPSQKPPIGSTGTYIFAIAAAKPGTLEFISNIATASFSVQ
jgi:M6 family metalloprotease-like protein